MSILVLAVTLGLVVLQAPGPQSPIRDVSGREWALLSPAPGTTHLLLFVSSDCPISNRYAPEVGRIVTAYAANGVQTFLIYEDPVIDGARVKTHVSDYYPGVVVPAIIDRDHAIARAVGARATPTAAVYTATGRAYRGRIDDWYVSLGQSRREPTERTLRLALDAVLAGRSPAPPETVAIGCHIGGAK
jgi:hypothetical protein